MKNSFAACALLAVAASVIALPAVHAQNQPASPTATRTFTSQDGTFRFEYSRSLIQCSEDPNRPAEESCSDYIPICTEGASDASDTVVCFAYPAGSLGRGTNFRGAAFAVSAIKEAADEQKCLNFALGEEEQKSSTEVVNGSKFKVTETAGGAMGHLTAGSNYRAFHHGVCYELGIRLSYSNVEMFDPGTVKEFDHAKVRNALKQVLATFKFLK